MSLIESAARVGCFRDHPRWRSCAALARSYPVDQAMFSQFGGYGNETYLLYYVNILYYYSKQMHGRDLAVKRNPSQRPRLAQANAH